MADFQKQTVQWFPGHMAKTRRIIKESLTLVDGVVELVDARIPYSSSNPELDSIIKRKPRIVLLNKCDIADPNATKLWIEYYKNNGKYAIPVDCRTGKGLNAFIPTVNKALADVIEKNKARGMENKPLRLMVVGIPNTGKSSFINRMAGNSKAKVADKAGVTRQKQWFAVGKGIELLDTPGVLWPKFDDSEVGDKLALFKIKIFMFCRSQAKKYQFNCFTERICYLFKATKIIASAKMYLMQNKTDLQPRFDVIEIYTDNNKIKSIKHLENAFQLV